MSKRKARAILRIIAVAVALLAALVLVRRLAQAACRNVGSDPHAEVICTPPVDAASIQTGSGDDTITLAEGVEVIAPQTAILTGGGDDAVYLYGAIYAGLDGVRLGSGNDELHNYGYLQAAAKGVSCEPQLGQTCTIYNYASGTMTATYETINIEATGGAAMVANEGTLVSSQEEVIHLRNDPDYGMSYLAVANRGRIESPRLAIEVAYTQVTLDNSGVMTVWRHEPVIQFGGQADSIINTGTISQTGSGTAIAMGEGRDTLTNYGAITASNSQPEGAVVDMGGGADTYWHGANASLTQVGVGYAAIEMGYGSDVVVIQGGEINGLINGDHHEGSRPSDHDVLVFEFDGDQSQLDAFRAEVEAQSPRGGSASWQGHTYTWQGFEAIHLNLNGSMPDAGKVVDASTVSAPGCPTALPGGVRSEASFSQPGSDVVMLQWEDSADDCMAVQSYTVVAFYGDFLQQWTFPREEIICNGTSCQATVSVPPDQPRFYWYVAASNALGTGSARNIRLFGYAP